VEKHNPEYPARPQRPRITQLGDFKLGGKIGSGAMGAVYRATQVSTKRQVAVKVLLKQLADNELFLSRFQREARVMSKLEHPNFVRCLAVGSQHGRHYLAMELVDGGSVRDWLHRMGRFSVADSLHIILVCARALQYAHDNALVHRDVKPDNILVTRDGQLKFADLGLARLMTEEVSLSVNGRGAGTPVYVAPEQARNARSADARSDLYALGCTLYQLVTGELPFRGPSSLEIVMAKLNAEYLPASARVPELPDEIDYLLSRMLAPHPDDRYQTCAELIEDIEALEMAGDRLSFLQADSQSLVGTQPEMKAEAGTQDFCLPDTSEYEKLTTPPVQLTWWDRHNSAVYGLLLTTGAVVAAAGIALLIAKR